MSQYTGNGPDPMDNLPNSECARQFKEAVGGTLYNLKDFHASWKWFYEGWCRAWQEAEECAEEPQKAKLQRRGVGF